MATYSIKDLETISGIKAHSLRIWEQRYNILQPKRTETNIRYYDDNDLKLLLNISALNCNGFKISSIALMTESEIVEKVQSFSEVCEEFLNQINFLTIAMIDLDEGRFEKIIASNSLRFGFEKTMTQIIYPFFERVGVLWQTGSVIPAHEHFISNLIRQKIIAAIDGQYSPLLANAPKYLLYLPEGEMHELSLLFCHYILKSHGNRVIYLGQSLPFEDLKSVYNTYLPDYIVTICTSRNGCGDPAEYLKLVSDSLPNAKICISGKAVKEIPLSLPPNVMLLNRIEELIELAKHRA